MDKTLKKRLPLPGASERVFHLLKLAGYPKFGAIATLASITGMHVNGVRRFLGEDRLPNNDALQAIVTRLTTDLNRNGASSKVTKKQVFDYLFNNKPISNATEVYASIESINTLAAGRIVLLIKQLADSYHIDSEDPDTAGRIHLIQDRLIKHHQKNPQVDIDSDDFLYVAKSLILLLKTEPNLISIN